jgi:hypothetical protein
MYIVQVQMLEGGRRVSLSIFEECPVIVQFRMLGGLVHAMPCNASQDVTKMIRNKQEVGFIFA